MTRSIENTVATCGVLFVIVFGANLFSFFMVQTQLPNLLAEGAHAANLSGPAVMTLIVIAYIVFGCFLEAIGMMLITVPVFLPLVTQFGYDPVWFGVIVVIVAEVGLIHPPVGLNLFVIQAHAPDIKITSIYRGIVPFLFAPLLLIILMFLFPRWRCGCRRCCTGNSTSTSQYFCHGRACPAISLRRARPCSPKRGRRDKPGDDKITSSSLPADRGPTGWTRTDPWPTLSASADCRGARDAARNSRVPRPSSDRARRTIR